MTAVLLVGDFPSTGIIPDRVAPRIADSAAPEASLAFVEGMSADLHRHGAVVVVRPAWGSDSALRLVRLARGLLDTDRIALVALDLPPLALSLVVDQLTFIAPHVRPGVLVSVAPVLADRLYAGAWVNSVAKLERVQTGLGQHMASLIPGSGFMVSAGRRPGVQRVTSSQPVPHIGHRPLDPLLLLAAHENGDVQWLQSKLKPELRAASLTFVAGQPLGSRYWGTKKYAEFVAFSGHPQDLQLALSMPASSPCPWCEEPTALPVCPFCHRAQPSRSESQPGQGVPAPETDAKVPPASPSPGPSSGSGRHPPGAYPTASTPASPGPAQKPQGPPTPQHPAQTPQPPESHRPVHAPPAMPQRVNRSPAPHPPPQETPTRRPSSAGHVPHTDGRAPDTVFTPPNGTGRDSGRPGPSPDEAQETREVPRAGSADVRPTRNR